MINMAHKDGDSTVQLVEVETGLFEVTLHYKDGVTTMCKTASYVRAIAAYLGAIANEAAYWAIDGDKLTIEELVVLQPGSW